MLYSNAMTEQLIGNYKILAKIGSGGMGDVFLGLDVMLEREVAIKSLRPELSQREDLIARFRSEAVAMGRLSHPNIATVYNFLYQDGQYFLIMEFVRGQTLDKILEQRGPMPHTEALPLLCSVLDGLEHAHRNGIVHRDIKPSNIMLTPSGLKLMDFGIARILQQARQTRSGHMVGTLEYMSPEHIQGLDTDARTDIYSVGIVAHELLTGNLPFRKNTDYEMIKAQVEELPPPLRACAADIPVAVEQAVAKALEKDAAKRYQSAAEFAQALESCTGGPGAASRRTSPESRPEASSRPWTGPVGQGQTPSGPDHTAGAAGRTNATASKRLIWGLGGAAVLLTLLGALLFFLSFHEGSPRPRQAASPPDTATTAKTATTSPTAPKSPPATMTLEQVRQAAANNDARAQLALGNRYASGRGVPQNQTLALEWYHKAAANGLPEAQLLVGSAFLTGHGTPPDLAQAEVWLGKAAQANIAGAAEQLGICYDKQEKYDKALEWLLKSNEQGDRKAPLYLGFTYVKLEDFPKAIPWLEKAATAGEAEAQFSLGMIYYNGLVGRKDYKKALRYIQEAANQDIPEAQYVLGTMYHYGMGVSADLGKALLWVRRAKENGYKKADKELQLLQ